MKTAHNHRPRFGKLEVLRVDSSARSEGSMSRRLADELIEQLREREGALDVRVRDLAVEASSFVDADWVDANFTPPEQRHEEQKAALAESNALVTELKAWVDMVARARLTFRYTEKGPVGLLKGKRAFLAVAWGGTAVGSEMDFATGYLRPCSDFWGSTMCTSWRPID